MFEQKKILVVDDEPNNLKLLKQILQDHYHLVFAVNGEKALAAAQLHHPDLILLDIMMPDMDGYQVCQYLKNKKETSHIPVIFVTAMDDIEDEARGFDAGAVDYITKPVSPAIVLKRVQNHLSLVKVDELEKSRLEIIHRLGRVAEFKDPHSSSHLVRMAEYCYLMALEAGFDEEQAHLLRLAAPMHDIGKIGIPDQLLVKPGPLTDEEWAVMRNHPQLGADILKGDSALMKVAGRVALTHHENWDGSGYPRGLREEEIPIEGRIVALADVFDAMTSTKPYQQARTPQQAIDQMLQLSGTRFDPRLLEIFVKSQPKMEQILRDWQDETSHL